MAKVTLNVKKNKLKELMKYLNQLDYVTVEEPVPPIYSSVSESIKDDIIPKSHQKFVLDRIASAKPKNYISIAETKKRIRKAKKK